MAMLFDFPMQTKPSFRPSHIQWHQKFPFLAAGGREVLQGTESGFVHIFGEDGELIQDSSIQRSAFPSALAWHPNQLLLVIGWDNGEMTIWNHAAKTAHECKIVHEGTIKFIQWTASGARLISGDDDGKFVLWKIMRGGRLTVGNEFKREGSMDCCVVRLSDASDDMADSKIDIKASSHDNAHFQKIPMFGPEPLFFIGTSTGTVYFCDGNRCEVAFSVEAAAHGMLFDYETDNLLVLSKTLMLTQAKVDREGVVTEKRDMKITGLSAGGFIWAGPHLVAVASHENTVRVFDLEQLDNFVLSLTEEKGDFSAQDIITSLAYYHRTNMLAGISNNGLVYLWKYKPSTATVDSESDARWVFQNPPTELTGPLAGVSYGPMGLLAVHNGQTLSLLKQQVLNRAFGDNSGALQLSSMKMIFEPYGRASVDIDVDHSIKTMAAKGDFTAACGNKQVSVFEYAKGQVNVRQAGSFKCDTQLIALFEQTVFTAEGNKIHARNFQGASKQVLPLADSEGEVTMLETNGKFLIAGTSSGIVRLWDLSRRDIKIHGLIKSTSKDLDGLRRVAVNSDGTRAAYLGMVGGEVDSSVWVWNVETDQTHTFDFGASGYVPVSIAWDPEDPKFLICETKPKENVAGANKVPQMTSLFSTPDEGLRQHDTMVIPEDTSFIGVQVPFVFFCHRPNRNDKMRILKPVTLRDLVGLEDADVETKSAMMSFSYYLTLGNMDEAFRAVRHIKTASVWENMAKMCVTTRRMDVASVCLGNMGEPLAARAVREATAAREPEVQIATLAVMLGMLDQAESLLKECGRHDLLNEMYQNQGRWDKALETAKASDRQHLRNTYYNYAKHLEANGRIQESIEYYERSETHRFEVPRMLFDQPAQLEAYIRRAQNKDLLKWWAQYLESSQDLDGALQFYTAADDTFSLVRVNCYQGNVAKAKDLVEGTGNKAAAYHLARQYENEDDIANAIKYYSKSECYNNAIRLAKEHNMKNEMLSLALRSTKADMIEAAEYYETQRMIDKAVTLYHKGGRVAKALELCFANKLYMPLAQICDDLDKGTDPELLQRAADFFLQNRQPDKAVNILLLADRYEEAINLCAGKNVIISDELAERMTLPKGDDEAENTLRNDLLEKIADTCAAQGSYQLATKKYTQAGNYVKAMKALLKCGDTEKIIFFANKCRTKEIYIMAANYLQQLDWRRDPEIMKNIIGFYTKAKGLEYLAAFYDSCAQVEIDEFQNYEKAQSALSEALKCMTKAKMKDFSEQEARVSALQQKLLLVKKYLSLKDMYDSDPQQMITQARLLIQEPDIETAVRLGDIFALIIEYYASIQEYQQAYSVMQEMRGKVPKVNMAVFVNMRTIETIHRALEIPLGRGTGAEDDDEVADEVNM